MAAGSWKAIVATWLVVALALAGCQNTTAAADESGADAADPVAEGADAERDADPQATEPTGTGSADGSDDVTPTAQAVVRPAVLVDQFGLDVEGVPEMALRWTDTNGDNVVVLSTNDEASVSGTIELFADHVVVGEGQEPRVLRHVQDGVVDCELDEFARFLFGAFRVTDADGDGLGEVTFAYEYQCAGDVSPAALKVLALEDGEKYIMRGQSWGSPQTRDGVGADELADGEPEPASEQWPAPLWEQTRELYAEAAIR